MKPILELRGITKRFGPVIANDHINLSLQKGEVLALLGENGAGKSTLMNILYGLYTQDEGDIYINGQKAYIHKPSDAIALGIGMVHQHFMLVPVFTVTDNVMLGSEMTEFGVVLKRNSVKKEIESISTKYGLSVDPNALVEDLSVGIQQRVEIIKILYRKAEIIIFDEPTAVLTPQEVEEFFKIVKEFIHQGKSIIFITHKLGEVRQIADRVIVLRHGKIAGIADPKTTSETDLANLMVGREVFLHTQKPEQQAGRMILDIQNLTVQNSRGFRSLIDVSFSVRAGEIFGVAGVQGNGQSELVEALFGMRSKEQGSVILDGTDISTHSPRKIHDAGVGYIPEDRQEDGLILSLPLYNNLILNSYHSLPFSRGGILQDSAIKEFSSEKVVEFDVRPPDIELITGSLSGGNQQKVIVARELSGEIKLLIAAQPTRGLDVGSIEYIHSQIIRKRNDGCAILLLSTELDEILSLSDRIGVIYRGKILKILDSDQANRESIGLLMAGMIRDQPGGNLG